MENLDEQNGSVAKRPTFLTVLCILSFIGSGWGIISALTMQDASLSAYAGYYYWLSALLSVGTLIGAFLMWKLKKMGLYIWTASTVISVVLMWVVIKGFLASLITPELSSAVENLEGTEGEKLGAALATAGTGMIEGVMNMALIMGSIFPAIFIILYWVNAKHLK